MLSKMQIGLYGLISHLFFTAHLHRATLPAIKKSRKFKEYCQAVVKLGISQACLILLNVSNHSGYDQFRLLIVSQQPGPWISVISDPASSGWAGLDW